MIYIILVLIFFFCFSLTFRLIIFNIHRIIYYGLKDSITYIKDKKWRLWSGFGIRMYCGYFGSGKSMLASKYVCDMYDKYKNSPTPLTVISNIPLRVPYIQLSNFQQITDVTENTIIYIDECNTLFNARSWKDFPVELVYQLCQNRKKHILLLMTAPRFHLVDKSIRDVTQFVYQCRRPFWRFHFVSVFDGWDFENAPNLSFLRSLDNYGVFASDKFYKNYDSFAVIDNVKKEEFLSKEEILSNRQGVCYQPDMIDKKHRKKERQPKAFGRRSND